MQLLSKMDWTHIFIPARRRTSTMLDPEGSGEKIRRLSTPQHRIHIMLIFIDPFSDPLSPGCKHGQLFHYNNVLSFCVFFFSNKCEIIWFGQDVISASCLCHNKTIETLCLLLTLLLPDLKRVWLTGRGTLSSHLSWQFVSSPPRSWLWESSRRPNCEVPSETHTWLQLDFIPEKYDTGCNLLRTCEMSSYPLTDCSVWWSRLQNPYLSPPMHTCRNGASVRNT